MLDVIVIGAGAAGMMAAARAASQGAKTLILEKNRKAGVKILMSGGTRCNLTHDCDAAGIMTAFGGNGKFLRQALAALGPRETIELFHSLGVSTKVESTGKVFPVNDRAVEVRDALLRLATSSGAELILGVAVKDVLREAEGFTVVAEGGSWRASKVIVTSGGQSWPGCGTTGDGYQWLTKFGHTIEKTYPALVPLLGGADWSRSLSGLTLESVGVSIWPKAVAGVKRPVLQRTGGFLFTHWGFSGPAVMDVSRAVTGAEKPTEVRFICDWVPQHSSEYLNQWMDDRRQKSGAQRISALLGELVPRRLAECICQATQTEQTPLGELSKTNRSQLLQALKQQIFPLSGSKGFEKAEVTAGGVRLSEVDPRTMSSRSIPGLYIAGEILDLDGWIGGYNFQSAFSTGHVAGLSAAATSL